MNSLQVHETITGKLIIIIIIIIKRGRCEAGREWHTPYQSEDPSPTISTYKQEEETGKNSKRLL